jgi:hypothetical protein
MELILEVCFASFNVRSETSAKLSGEVFRVIFFLKN